MLGAIQDYRRAVANVGNLKSNQYQKVRVVPDKDILIEPARPDVVYVPSYDPVLATQPQPAQVVQQSPGINPWLAFGGGAVVGALGAWALYSIFDGGGHQGGGYYNGQRSIRAYNNYYYARGRRPPAAAWTPLPRAYRARPQGWQQPQRLRYASPSTKAVRRAALRPPMTGVTAQAPPPAKVLQEQRQEKQQVQQQQRQEKQGQRQEQRQRKQAAGAAAAEAAAAGAAAGAAGAAPAAAAAKAGAAPAEAGRGRRSQREPERQEKEGTGEEPVGAWSGRPTGPGQCRPTSVTWRPRNQRIARKDRPWHAAADPSRRCALVAALACSSIIGCATQTAGPVHAPPPPPRALRITAQRNQSQRQQDGDKADCQSIASGQATSSDSWARVFTACMGGRGYMVE